MDNDRTIGKQMYEQTKKDVRSYNECIKWLMKQEPSKERDQCVVFFNDAIIAANTTGGMVTMNLYKKDFEEYADFKEHQKAFHTWQQQQAEKKKV